MATQARPDILAEHDQTWIDPTFTSPLTGVVVQLMRDASRAASPDTVDDARRFTDALHLREAKSALTARQLGALDREIQEAEVTDPDLVAAIHDLGAGRITQLTPEQNATLSCIAITGTIPSELDSRLAENGFELPRCHPDRHAQVS